MEKTEIRLRVFFSDPFWIGLLERVTEEGLCVCKITFDAEPREYEISGFLLRNFYSIRFSPLVEGSFRPLARNPKRRQREAGRQTCHPETGTKSQQALKLLQEESKQSRMEKSRERRDEEKRRHFDLKQRKRKEKHRGR